MSSLAEAVPSAVECFTTFTPNFLPSYTSGQCPPFDACKATSIVEASLSAAQPRLVHKPVPANKSPNLCHTGGPEQPTTGSPYDEVATSLAGQPQGIQSIWENFFNVLTSNPADVWSLDAQFAHCKMETDRYPLETQTVQNLQKVVMSRFRSLPYGSIGRCGTLQMVHDVLRYLLSIGCTLEDREPLGKTCFLHASVTYGYGLMDYLFMLVQNGADVQAKDHLGRGALHLVLNRFNFDEAGHALVQPRYSNDDEDRLVFLLKAGCDPTAKDFEGKEPIEYIIHDEALTPIWIHALTRAKHRQGLQAARRMLSERIAWSEYHSGRPAADAQKITTHPLFTVPGLFSSHLDGTSGFRAPLAQ